MVRLRRKETKRIKNGRKNNLKGDISIKTEMVL